METKILIIEDEVTISEPIRAFFESEGYDVKVACDGSEGISFFKMYDPDITVLATIKDAVEDYDPEFTQPHRRAEFAGLDIASLPGINEEVPVIWVHHYGKGRVMGVSIGHGPDTLRRPNYVGLLARGCEWCATGECTIPYPDLAGWKRLNAWPYYKDITWQDWAKLTSF